MNFFLLFFCVWQAREGLGGGFDERQDRASVATVEVDEDGYDDFGRKKNKARADKKAKEVSFGLAGLDSAELDVCYVGVGCAFPVVYSACCF